MELEDGLDSFGRWYVMKNDHSAIPRNWLQLEEIHVACHVMIMLQI